MFALAWRIFAVFVPLAFWSLSLPSFPSQAVCVVVAVCLLQGESGSDEESDGEEKVRQQEWLQWKEHSLKTRYKLDMGPDAAPWTSDHQLRGLPRTPRNLDIVQVAHWAWLRSTGGIGDKQDPKWFVDTTQSVHRLPWGPHPMSFNQATKLYSFELDRCLDAEDFREIFDFPSFPPMRPHVRHSSLLRTCKGFQLNDKLRHHRVGARSCELIWSWQCSLCMFPDILQLNSLARSQIRTNSC